MCSLDSVGVGDVSELWFQNALTFSAAFGALSLLLWKLSAWSVSRMLVEFEKKQEQADGKISALDDKIHALEKNVISEDEFNKATQTMRGEYSGLEQRITQSINSFRGEINAALSTLRADYKAATGETEKLRDRIENRIDFLIGKWKQKDE